MRPFFVLQCECWSAPANKVYCFALWKPDDDDDAGDDDDSRKESGIFRVNEIFARIKGGAHTEIV